MLDEDFEDVVDANESALHRDREGPQHRLQVRVQPLQLARSDFVLRRDPQLEHALAFLTLAKAGVLQRHQVTCALRVVVARVFDPLVVSHQLEFEATDAFGAAAVVADDAHVCHLAQVVLVLVEEDL